MAVANQVDVDVFRAKMFESEHEEQAALVAWASSMEFMHPELGLLYAIPNGARLPRRKGKNGKWYSPEARKLKAEGLRPGVPDLCLPVARGGWFGIYIELKHGRNKPSDAQATMLDKLTEQGYLAVACWGYEEAKETLLSYLVEPKTKGKG